MKYPQLIIVLNSYFILSPCYRNKPFIKREDYFNKRLISSVIEYAEKLFSEAGFGIQKVWSADDEREHHKVEKYLNIVDRKP